MEHRRTTHTCFHRRNIYTEDNAKVVAAVWGTEFIKFLATLAILHQDDMKDMMNCTRMILNDMKKRMNSSYSTNHPGGK